MGCVAKGSTTRVPFENPTPLFDAVTAVTENCSAFGRTPTVEAKRRMLPLLIVEANDTIAVDGSIRLTVTTPYGAGRLDRSPPLLGTSCGVTRLNEMTSASAGSILPNIATPIKITKAVLER
jgi:hypothetical protein